MILFVRDKVIFGCSSDPAGGPIQFSAVCHDKNNQVCLKIIKNEWRTSAGNWDVKQIGIEIEFSPPKDINFIGFTTYFNGHKLVLDKQQVLIRKVDGSSLLFLTDGPIRRSAPIYISPHPTISNESQSHGRVPLAQDPVILQY